MRIDKYLWCIRVFKTRTIATTACKKGQVKMDAKSLKPSKRNEIEIVDLLKNFNQNMQHSNYLKS